MNSFTAIEIKGWCPGVLRPMESGDGLIARVKPRISVLTLEQASGLADAAERLGNGQIDLTRRANLQIRGLEECSLPALHKALDRLGLLDPDAETEAARSIMVGPSAGSEVRAMATALSEAVVADCALVAALPAKFGWSVDAAGPLSITGERADITLCAMPEGVALRVGRQWQGIARRDRAVSVALAAAHAHAEGGAMPPLAKLDVAPAAGTRKLGAVGDVFGVAAPFGRLDASQLRALVRLAVEAGASELRLSPWHALYIDAPIEGVRDLGLIVEDDDQLLRIDACPGMPACRSASVDTRREARRLAALGFAGSVHISGCSKGCARSAPADLVLVGSGGRYGVIRNGTTHALPRKMIDPDDLVEALDG